MNAPLKRLTYIYFALLGLLALTVALSQVPLGTFAGPLALTIAALKAILVARDYMKLKTEPAGLQVIALAPLFWVGVFIALVWADVLMRGSVGIPGK